MLSHTRSFITQNPALTATVVGCLTLAAAFVSEYGYGLHPCEMCWWQRYPYMIAAVFLLAMQAMGMRERRITLFILSVIFAANAFIAGYHVGVEQKWWAGITSCASTGTVGTIDDMLEALKNTTLVRCDEIQFSLFGISMAGYNGLIALSLALFTAYHGKRSVR